MSIIARNQEFTRVGGISTLERIAPKSAYSKINEASVDVSVGMLHRVHSVGFVGTYVNSFPEEEEVATQILDNKREGRIDANVWILQAGQRYIATLNEKIVIPLDYAAIFIPRSTFMRMGVYVNTGFYDPGYVGKGRALLTPPVHTDFLLQQNARIGQLVYFTLDSPVVQGYNGQYNQEGLAFHGITYQ